MSDTVSLILFFSFYMKGYFLILDGLFLLLYQIRFSQMYIFRRVLGFLMVSLSCFTFYLSPPPIMPHPAGCNGWQGLAYRRRLCSHRLSPLTIGPDLARWGGTVIAFCSITVCLLVHPPSRVVHSEGWMSFSDSQFCSMIRANLVGCRVAVISQGWVLWGGGGIWLVSVWVHKSCQVCIVMGIGCALKPPLSGIV